MKLASLKQKYSDLESAKPAGAETDEYYPTIYLEEKQLEALDLDNQRVGTELQMIATVRVSRVSESKSGDRSMSVEIIEAAMSAKEDDADAAKTLFPNE